MGQALNRRLNMRTYSGRGLLAVVAAPPPPLAAPRGDAPRRSPRSHARTPVRGFHGLQGPASRGPHMNLNSMCIAEL